jgi:hypothetical protein
VHVVPGRLLAVAASTLATALTGAGVADAASAPPPHHDSAAHTPATRVHTVPAHTAVSHPLPGAVTVPAQGLKHLSNLSQDAAGGHGDATMESDDWSGYGVDGGTYTTVSADRVEPSVSRNTDGIVGFWMGLDGLDSSRVEQTGTAVSCQSGSPVAFAWWETYPANSVREYAVAVDVGDHLSSTVTYEGGGEYDLALNDLTQGWSENRPVTRRGGFRLRGA